MTAIRSKSSGSYGNRETVVAEADSLVSKGNHKDALRLFLNLAEKEGASPGDGIWGRVAACYRKLSRPDEIASLEKRLRASGLPTVQVYLQFALAYADAGKFEDAVGILESAQPHYGPNQQVHIFRIWAELLSDENRHDEALTCVASMFDLGTPAADSLARISLALVERKKRRAELQRSSPEVRLRAYWKERKDTVYIHVCRQLIGIMGQSAGVVADIGSNRTPTLDFFPGTPIKYSVDPGSPYENADVESVREDFFAWKPLHRIQLTSCLQVMEHVEDVGAFAKRLLENSEVVLISVPYLEAPGLNEGHIHSEIDLERIKQWFDRPPNYHFVARELSGAERIICVFDSTTTTEWPTLCEHCIHGLSFKYRWSLKGASLSKTGDRFSAQ